MSELVERVARAVAEEAGATWEDSYRNGAGDAYIQGVVSCWELAQVAIAAVREPTEAVELFIRMRGIDTPEEWRAAIDEVLKP